MCILVYHYLLIECLKMSITFSVLKNKNIYFVLQIHISNFNVIIIFKSIYRILFNYIKLSITFNY